MRTALAVYYRPDAFRDAQPFASAMANMINTHSDFVRVFTQMTPPILYLLLNDCLRASAAYTTAILSVRLSLLLSHRRFVTNWLRDCAGFWNVYKYNPQVDQCIVRDLQLP